LKGLELRVPPVALVIAFAAGMWLLKRAFPPMGLPSDVRGIVAALLAAAGCAATVAGVLEFRRARTTVNPLQPEAASTIVATGIYRWSRNPMYLGMLLVLAAWAAWLDRWVAWFALPLFVLYMNRFQVLPEERALRARFGAPFDDYCRRVRRWL
jgi:protein-S-isoprenylcysteine O-methyltransferase Ste14